MVWELAAQGTKTSCPAPTGRSSARARLEKLLHLDVPLLRNPLTALSVFTPLVTAALAAFIPQLGAG